MRDMQILVSIMLTTVLFVCAVGMVVSYRLKWSRTRTFRRVRTWLRPRFRVLEHDEETFEAQVWRWWWPMWRPLHTWYGGAGGRKPSMCCDLATAERQCLARATYAPAPPTKPLVHPVEIP